MSVEEQFRDTKGSRFGMRLKWTDFQRAECLERMYLLVGVAVVLWMTIGRSLEQKNPKIRLYSKKKGARISLLRVGIFYWKVFVGKFRLSMKFIKAHLPKPKIRIFKWLVALQN